MDLSTRLTYFLVVPSTVADIFAAASAAPAGVVAWNTPPAPPTPRTALATGIYVVALTSRLEDRADALVSPPISKVAVDELLDVRPELTLDSARPTREQLVQRLSAFWFPDEVVVYIGLAGPRKNRPVQGEVAKRVREYYDTPLGANAPHAGGWFLKTLGCLQNLYVHYSYCDGVEKAEGDCIRAFAERVSDETRAALRDPVRVMPFANLEFPKGNHKNHGIRGARAPKVTRRAQRDSTPPGEAIHEPPSAGRVSTPPFRPRRVAGAAALGYRSQQVTPNDIKVGQVRIPIGATKSILPRTRQDIAVVVRGRGLTCHWDPRYGERERSGVIRVGKAAAAALLSPGDVLAVAVEADGSVSLE